MELQNVDIECYLTDEESDELYNLVSQLPGQYFRSEDNWLTTLGKICFMVQEARKRKEGTEISGEL